jgi:septal ring factor EnvC (AmiA/AmiB activator)
VVWVSIAAVIAVVAGIVGFVLYAQASSDLDATRQDLKSTRAELSSAGREKASQLAELGSVQERLSTAEGDRDSAETLVTQLNRKVDDCQSTLRFSYDLGTGRAADTWNNGRKLINFVQGCYGRIPAWFK